MFVVTCSAHFSLLGPPIHSSPTPPQSHPLLIFITNLKIQYLLFKMLWISKLSIHWWVVGNGCRGRLSRDVHWVALRTESSVLPTPENPSGCHPIPRSLQASFSSPLYLYPPSSQELLLISPEGSESRIRMFVWWGKQLSWTFHSCADVLCSCGSCLTTGFRECSLSQFLVWVEPFPELFKWGWMHVK